MGAFWDSFKFLLCLSTALIPCSRDRAWCSGISLSDTLGLSFHAPPLPVSILLLPHSHPWHLMSINHQTPGLSEAQTWWLISPSLEGRRPVHPLGAVGGRQTLQASATSALLRIAPPQSSLSQFSGVASHLAAGWNSSAGRVSKGRSTSGEAGIAVAWCSP